MPNEVGKIYFIEKELTNVPEDLFCIFEVDNNVFGLFVTVENHELLEEALLRTYSVYKNSHKEAGLINNSKFFRLRIKEALKKLALSWDEDDLF